MNQAVRVVICAILPRYWHISNIRQASCHYEVKIKYVTDGKQNTELMSLTTSKWLIIQSLF